MCAVALARSPPPRCTVLCSEQSICSAASSPAPMWSVRCQNHHCVQRLCSTKGAALYLFPILALLAFVRLSVMMMMIRCSLWRQNHRSHNHCQYQFPYWLQWCSFFLLLPFLPLVPPVLHSIGVDGRQSLCMSQIWKCQWQWLPRYPSIVFEDQNWHIETPV